MKPSAQSLAWSKRSVEALLIEHLLCAITALSTKDIEMNRGEDLPQWNSQTLNNHPSG